MHFAKIFVMQMCVTHERFPQSILVVVVTSGLFPEISMKCYTKTLNLAFRKMPLLGIMPLWRNTCVANELFFSFLKTTILISNVRYKVMYGIENPERCETSASDSGVNGHEVIQCLEV